MGVYDCCTSATGPRRLGIVFELIENSLIGSIELYRRDLFVCEDSMHWILEKTPVELTSSQKARLNGTVVRCFLPALIPLNIQKDGLAVHIKNIAPLVEAIVSLVH